MLTGKDLILYILQNNLENESISNFLLTEEEAAVVYEVGVATLHEMVKLNTVPGIKINNKYYIFKCLKRGEHEKKNT